MNTDDFYGRSTLARTRSLRKSSGISTNGASTSGIVVAVIRDVAGDDIVHQRKVPVPDHTDSLASMIDNVIAEHLRPEDASINVDPALTLTVVGRSKPGVDHGNHLVSRYAHLRRARR